MNAAPSPRAIRFFQRPTLRYGRGFLHDLTAEYAVLVLSHGIDPGTSVFLEMRSLDLRLTRTPLATVTRSEQESPGRWVVRCRFALPLNVGELHLARCA